MKYLNDYSCLMEQMIVLNKHRTIVEIGVQRGQTSLALCNAAKQTGGKLFGFDLWDKHGLKRQHSRVGSPEEVSDLLKSHGFDNFELTRKNTRDHDFKDVVREKTGGVIDFAFIDGCHSYVGALNDLQAVYPLMNSTGIIAFHDTRMIDGCRELIIDLRTKYYDGTYDVFDFFGGYGDMEAGLSFLVKRQFPVLKKPISEKSGSISSFSEILQKEQNWYTDETSRHTNSLMSVDLGQLQMNI